ncbi:mCG148392 [Mus musculus]|nr:mCG148392 [Mus musculus]
MTVYHKGCLFLAHPLPIWCASNTLLVRAGRGLWIKPRALNMLGKPPTTKQYPHSAPFSPLSFYLAFREQISLSKLTGL